MGGRQPHTTSKSSGHMFLPACACVLFSCKTDFVIDFLCLWEFALRRVLVRVLRERSQLSRCVVRLCIRCEHRGSCVQRQQWRVHTAPSVKHHHIHTYER